MSFGIDTAHFMGILVGLLLYGFYFAIFLATMFHIRRRSTGSRVVSSVLVSLCLLSTAYYGLAAADIYIAFIPDRITPGVDAHLSDWSDPIAPTKDCIYMVALLLADCLLAWRLYVIWPENRFALATATTLILTLTAAGLCIAVYEIRQQMLGRAVYVHKVYMWTVVASAVSIANNLLMTCCIAGRLWWMSLQISAMGQRATSLYHRISYVIIQSGFLYLLCMTLQLCLFAAGVTNAIYFFLHISPAIIAMFPTAIILQLTLQAKERPSQFAPEGPATLSHWAAAPADAAHNTDSDGTGTSGTLTGYNADGERRQPTNPILSAISSILQSRGAVDPELGAPSKSFIDRAEMLPVQEKAADDEDKTEDKLDGAPSIPDLPSPEKN